MKRIIVIGEKCLDVFVYGPCHRISPEAPVPIQLPTRTESNLGMAANVVENIKSLSPETEIDFFHQPQDIIKVRHVDEFTGQQLMRVDMGENSNFDGFFNKVLSEMKEGYDALVISDYAKGLLHSEILSKFINIFHQKGIPIFMDTKLLLGEWSKKVDFVKINSKELNNHLKGNVLDPWNFCQNLIVTRGKDGSVLFNEKGEFEYVSAAYPKKIFNLSGCGDTYLAALVVKYLETKNIQEAMDWASKAASLAASKPGVVAIAREEMERE